MSLYLVGLIEVLNLRVLLSWQDFYLYLSLLQDRIIQKTLHFWAWFPRTQKWYKFKPQIGERDRTVITDSRVKFFLTTHFIPLIVVEFYRKKKILQYNVYNIYCTKDSPLRVLATVVVGRVSQLQLLCCVGSVLLPLSPSWLIKLWLIKAMTDIPRTAKTKVSVSTCFSCFQLSFNFDSWFSLLLFLFFTCGKEHITLHLPS